MSPTLSVIVPIYNMEKYLQKCVDSILTQTFRDFELILVDDGSKDKSAEICDEYARKDNRVKVIHKENGGAGSARNVGIRNAGGEYITFVDSDDYLDRDHLQNYADNCHKADLIIQGYKRRNGEKIEEFSLKDEYFSRNALDIIHSEVMYKFFGNNWSYNWNKLYRAEIIRKYEIFSPENVPLFEDRLFDLQYYERIDSFLALPTSSYNYVYRADSLSRRRSYLPEDMILIAQTYEKYIEQSVPNSMRDEVFACAARFYLRALSLVFLSQKRGISQRFSEFIFVHKKLWSSLLIQKNGLKSFRYFLRAMQYYLRKLGKRK